ncbi:MAG: hypothetical protein WCB96_06625 [Candidatus Aminicenantales bacterium]
MNFLKARLKAARELNPTSKARKAGLSPLALRMKEKELKPVPSKGWAALIQKVYEVDPMLCPKCGGGDEGRRLPHGVCRRG